MRLLSGVWLGISHTCGISHPGWDIAGSCDIPKGSYWGLLGCTQRVPYYRVLPRLLRLPVYQSGFACAVVVVLGFRELRRIHVLLSNPAPSAGIPMGCPPGGGGHHSAYRYWCLGRCLCRWSRAASVVGLSPAAAVVVSSRPPARLVRSLYAKGR